MFEDRFGVFRPSVFDPDPDPRSPIPDPRSPIPDYAVRIFATRFSATKNVSQTPRWLMSVLRPARVSL